MPACQKRALVLVPLSLQGGGVRGGGGGPNDNIPGQTSANLKRRLSAALFCFILARDMDDT
jgi:hypothetical protein